MPWGLINIPFDELGRIEILIKDFDGLNLLRAQTDCVIVFIAFIVPQMVALVFLFGSSACTKVHRGALAMQYPIVFLRACYALWISWFRTAHDGLILAKHSALKAIPLAIFINIHSVKRYFDLS